MEWLKKTGKRGDRKKQTLVRGTATGKRRILLKVAAKYAIYANSSVFKNMLTAKSAIVRAKLGHKQQQQRVS